MKKTYLFGFTSCLLLAPFVATLCASEFLRERTLIDSEWRFSLGHATDVSKDFNYASGTFSHFAKAGFGAGASSSNFDDSGWRLLDLPHDWAVELPFDSRGSGSHGFKAIGRSFPENSVGWYRKRFTIPESDLGKWISVEFDGIFRDSTVWINGHFIGSEESGYSDAFYNLTEALNYGGENVLVVRVDASLEEGWFYEGAGIYRHAWLVKTDPVHFERNGISITSEVSGNAAEISVRSSVVNEGRLNVACRVDVSIVDRSELVVASGRCETLALEPGEKGGVSTVLDVASAKLWSIESPELYTLVSEVVCEGKVVDRIETPFGIRTISIDAENGFLLNGKPVKLKGSNNHQDHAGLGVAMPDAMHEWRIKQLQKMGSNAYRCSHNPPTPEFLDACDRLGMLVIDENRLMGTSAYHYDHLERMIRRDRNHPSVVLWSIGNEEWGIEGSDTGERMTRSMQDFARRIDTTRPITAAVSGGWGKGISTTIQVAGLNYLDNMAKAGYSPDSWHAAFPDQPVIGSEECALNNTRGVYSDDASRSHLNAYDWDPSNWGSSLEYAWRIYADREWLAGIFLWTGFDYRGEPTPFGWPAINSQFGILDTCGFPKDAFYYLKSWWSDEPVLHVFPHWNWRGREGEAIDVWVYSNCEEVELFLDGSSLGRKTMERNGHLEWKVIYEPGTLSAIGYKGAESQYRKDILTTGETQAVKLSASDALVGNDGVAVWVVTAEALDGDGRTVPTANNLLTFELEGPGGIIGVGNGDPGSLEADVYLDGNTWKRRLFSGYAQIIVSSSIESGSMTLKASGVGLSSASVPLEVGENDSDG